MTDVRLLVFCKAPVAGEVKTRLFSQYSAVEAANIHRQLATETIADCLAVDGVQLELWCGSHIDHEFFASYLAAGVPLFQQQGADLGEKMRHGLASGTGPAILIGTDCPPIDTVYLAAALQQLPHTDVLLAPAEDGGYGLIGICGVNNDQLGQVFADIAWSTPEVLATTLARCEQADLKVTLLPEIWDVDYPADVDRWRCS